MSKVFVAPNCLCIEGTGSERALSVRGVVACTYSVAGVAVFLAVSFFFSFLSFLFFVVFFFLGGGGVFV